APLAAQDEHSPLVAAGRRTHRARRLVDADVHPSWSTALVEGRRDRIGLHRMGLCEEEPAIEKRELRRDHHVSGSHTAETCLDDARTAAPHTGHSRQLENVTAVAV